MQVLPLSHILGSVREIVAAALNFKSPVLHLIHIWLTEVHKTITTQHHFISDGLRVVRGEASFSLSESRMIRMMAQTP